MIKDFNDIQKLKEFAVALAVEKEDTITQWGMDKYWDYVIQANSRIIELDANEANAYTRLAKAYYENGKLLQALQLYKQIIEDNISERATRTANGFLNRHKHLEDNKRLLESIKSYEEAITIAISIRRSQGPSKIAIEVLRKAYKHSKNISQKVKIAAELRKNKESDLAKKLLESIKKEDSDNTATDITMAATLRREKSSEEALLLYKKVLEKEPENNVAQIGMASVLKDLKRIDEAFDILDNYPVNDHKNPYFLNTLYSIALKTENYKQAENAYKILSKYYDRFEPLKFLNQLISHYKTIKYDDGVNRMTNAKEVLEKKIN